MIGGGEQMQVFDINYVFFFSTKSLKWTKVLVAERGIENVTVPPGFVNFPRNRKCHSLSQNENYVYISGGQYMSVLNY